MGTELIEKGLEIRSDIAERWVLERADVVSGIHRAYIEAGADAIQTCTFGALRSRLAPYALQERVTDICLQATSLARAAARGRGVIGSLGPTTGDVEAEVGEAAAVLAAAGVDAIHLETQYAADDLIAAAAGVRRAAPDVPLWISVTVTTGPTGLETPHGTPLARMIAALAKVAPDAVGVNCSLDADRIRDAVERLVHANLGPVVAKPQARMSEKCAPGRGSETPSRFAERAARLFDLGAAAVGGCCGTSPASIAALSATVTGKQREPRDPQPQEVTR